MIVYYALGGGLGHLVRARKLLDTLGYRDRAALLSASPFADDARVVGDLPVVRVPPRLGHDRAAFRAWLKDALAALRPELLIVDSFPGGILGELCGLELPPACHVARRLRWPAYAQRCGGGPLPRFELTYVLEPLMERHELALSACSAGVRTLELPVPRTDPGAPLTDRPHWLVVHSGPDAELVELAEYASEMRAAERGHPRILVIAPHRPQWLPRDAQWCDIHPATPHFANAERIFTAAGFNAMRETSELRDRHRFVPFPRPLDDQYARARHAVLEHDRPPVVGDHPVVEVAAQRPRQHHPLEVAPDPHQVIDGVAVPHSPDVLVDDRARV
jgi:hypothetical protein